MTLGYAYFSRDLYIPLGIYIYFCGDIYIPVGISIFLWGYIYIFLWGYIYSCGDIYIPVGMYIPVGYIYIYSILHILTIVFHGTRTVEYQPIFHGVT